MHKYSLKSVGRSVLLNPLILTSLFIAHLAFAAAPIISPLPDQTISEDAPTFSLEVKATDADNDMISLSQSISNTNLATLSLSEHWSQSGTDIDGEAAEDQSGYAVTFSADGSTLAVGAPFNDDGGASSGHVRVYTNLAGTWTQLGADINGKASNDLAGASVALSADGSILALGALASSGVGAFSGQARVYQYSGGAWTQLGTDISGEAASDQSGQSVSLSKDGLTLAVGATYNNGNGTNSGHVRVYHYSAGAWVQSGADIDGEAAGDRSGYSVSLSADGSKLAIGAIKNSGNGVDSGHVRIYQYSGGIWTKIGADIDGEAAGDLSGYSVSLSEDGATVAIGAPNNSNSGGIYSGQVRVYAYSAGTWTKVGSDIDGKAENNLCGYSLSLSADALTVAIGGPGSTTDNGRARIYHNTMGAWTQIGADIVGEALNDQSGASVALSPNALLVAVGAYQNDGNGPQSGHVRLYTLKNLLSITPTPNMSGSAEVTLSASDGTGNETNSTFNLNITGVNATPLITPVPDQNILVNAAAFTVEVNATDLDNDTLLLSQAIRNPDLATLALSRLWSQSGTDIDGEAAGDESGRSVTCNAEGSIVAIGASLNDSNGAESGHVRVYQHNAGVWSQLGAEIAGEAANDQSGTSVALSADGLSLAIGATGNSGNGSASGHVRIYRYSAGAWTQLGADIDGEAAGDNSGFALSVSTDGLTVAVGAPFNNGNGAQSGQVRVYHYRAGLWTQIGADIDGESAGDLSGVSVSLSADGLTLAVGAPWNNGNGAYSGQVRIYRYNTGAWTQIGTDIDGEASGDQSGTSVSLSADGSSVAIGAIGNDGNGAQSGHVRVYRNNADIWTQVGADIDGEAAGDRSGRSVALSSDGLTLAIGADLNSGTGHVRVYQNIYGTWTQIGADLEGEAADDQSGGAVALSQNGQILVVGAPLNDGNGAQSGHVRIHTLKNLLSIAPKPGAYGKTMVVLNATDSGGESTGSSFKLNIQSTDSAPVITPVADQSVPEDTAAFTVEVNATDSYHEKLLISQVTGDTDLATLSMINTWSQSGADIDGEAAGDQSGRSVALSADGSTLAVGAPNNDANGANSGQVRVYKKMAGVWTQLGGDIDGEAAGDQSGYAVALSVDGLILAVGANLNSGQGSNSGHVRIYRYDAGVWMQLGADIDGKTGDQSGYAVALSLDGMSVAIGAPFNTANGTRSGQVRIFRYVAGAWTQVGADINGEAAYNDSGAAVSLSADGMSVAIGAYTNNDNGADSGHVRVYQYLSGAWMQIGADIDGEAAGDYSGYTVALSADALTLAVGAIRNDGNGVDSGQVRVYQYGAGVWIQTGADINGEAAGDQSGRSLALSANGMRVAIGAYVNDGNGINSGHVRVYNYLSGAWTQVGADIDGEAAGDYCGRSAALSADGITLAAGAIYNDGNGVDSGHVRVYTLKNMLSITPNPNLYGTALVTLNAADSFGNETNSTFQLTVTSVADLPVITPVSDQSVLQDSGTFSVEVNATDGDNDTLFLSQTISNVDLAALAMSHLWSQSDADIDGEAANDESGSSVAFNADASIVAIGAPFNDGINGFDSGQVRVYQNNAGTWTQIGADIDGEAANDQSGSAVSLSADGMTLAVGAPGNDGNGAESGHVRIYRYSAGAWTQTGLDIDGESAGDLSGSAVAISTDGMTLAVGAPWNSGNGSGSGQVRIYKNIAGVWTQTGGDIDGEAANDQSGMAVSLSADALTVAIGATGNSANGTFSGHVRVYHYNAGVWTQLGADIDAEAAYDLSGTSVSLNAEGSTLAVGAPYNDGNGNNSGHVRVYKNIAGVWTQLGMDIDGEAADDQSGKSVSLSADGLTLAVGALQNDGNGAESGHVRIYRYSAGTWTQIGADIDGEAAGDYSGTSVALSADGQALAIGAYRNDGSGLNSGHVRTYRLKNLLSITPKPHLFGTAVVTLSATDGTGNTTENTFNLNVISTSSAPLITPVPDQSVPEDSATFTVEVNVNDSEHDTFFLSQNISNTDLATLTMTHKWFQSGSDIDGEAADDKSGTSIAFSADGLTLAVGAPMNSGNGVQSGQVRVYKNIAGVWTQLGADIDGEAAYDHSGSAVALSTDGLSVAVGATGNDGNGVESGHVRIYSYSGGVWTQRGADINGEAANDYSGISLALSADALTVAIGAFSNSGNGAQSGQVRIFHYSGGSWTQTGADIDGEAAGDQSGTSVALSSDGQTVAIGAIGNDGNGADSGQVRVYKYDGAAWRQVGADIDGETAYDQSGASVSLGAGGLRVAIGAIGNDGNGNASGQVRVYQYSAGNWTQLGMDIDGEAPYDLSGISVSLSADALTLAVGAGRNGENGAQSGHVRIYKYGGGAWMQVGADLDGEAAGDESGSAVALSADGLSVAVGAAGNDANGAQSGHVRIYRLKNLLSITPKPNANGMTAVTLIATDQTGSEANSTFNLNVTSVNDAPTITAIPDQNVAENAATFSVEVNTSDVENETLFLSQTISDSNLATLLMEYFWSQSGSDIDGEATMDTSGSSVALSVDGSIVAIGAKRNDGNGNNSGQVRVYKNIAGTWSQMGADIDGEAADDQSGSAISLSADGLIVAIGAVGNDGNGPNSGHVRVYQYGAGIWTQLGTDIDGEAPYDLSGSALSLSADGLTLAVGAIYSDGNGSDSGQVRVYHYSGGTWAQLGSDIDGEATDDESGGSVSLSADGFTVAIGATKNDGNGANSGHVRVYHYSLGVWTQVGADIDGESVGDESGNSVALSADGQTVAIGAPQNDGSAASSGHVRIYRYNAGTWTQLGTDIDGKAAYDISGSALSLSRDGLSIAIGASGNDDAGTNSGQVRFYRYAAGTWTQVGADIDGEAPLDYSGYSLSLSKDGSTLAVGAYGNDGNGVDGGHVRIYRFKNLLSITPKPNVQGTATVTLNAMDGTGSDTNSTFNLTINGVAASSSSSTVSSTTSSSSSSSSAVVVSSSSSSLSSAISSSSLASSVASSASSSASDTDGDGINDTIEQSVPNPEGGGFGDGNGDATGDYLQAYVSALQGANGWLVLSNAQHYGQSGLNIQTAPADTPDDVSFPYGFITFQINGITPGESVNIELYVPYDENINGYWKKDNSGKWHNIAGSISHEGTMTKITFTLSDGGVFDSDGNVNGVIIDPGAPGSRTSVAVPFSDTAKVLMMLLFLTAASLFMKRCRRA